MSIAASSLEAGCFTVPAFAVASEELQSLIEHSSRSVVDNSFEADGLAAVANRINKGEVAPNAMILIPERAPMAEEAENFSYLSQCAFLLFQVQGLPGPRSTFGTCAGYTSHFMDCSIPVGTLLRFNTPDYFLVARGQFPEATPPGAAATDNENAPLGGKRARELLDDLGEQQGGGERSLANIVDLDGRTHVTRCRKDVTQRAKDLAFGFRMVDKERWTYLMGADFLLQPNEYNMMIMEQAKTRASGREPAFESCGLADRIRNLRFADSPSKLKSLVTGSIFDGLKDSIVVADLETKGLPIATGVQPDVNSNVNLVAMLRNLEAVLIVFFSAAFVGVFAGLLEDLEGFKRPLELVSADYLKHSIETELSKFFRVIRNQRSCDDPSLALAGPQKCAAFLQTLLSALAKDLGDDGKRVHMETYHLLTIRKEKAAKVGTVAAVPPSEKAKEKVTAVPEKVVTRSEKAARPAICGLHFGNQIGAISDRTNAEFACTAGAECKFRHISVKGKAKADLISIIEDLPTTMRPSMMAAVSKKT